MAILLRQDMSQHSQLINGPGNAPPSRFGCMRIALAVDAEVGVVLSLDQPVAALLAVAAPRLYGERDVCVELVFGCARFVRLRNHGLDFLALVQAPKTEGVKEGDLLGWSALSATWHGATYALRRGHGVE